MADATTTIQKTTPDRRISIDPLPHGAPAPNGPTRGISAPRTFLRLIRAGFSDGEWAALSSRADFLSQVQQATSIDAAEAVILRGAELIEGVAKRPQPFLTPQAPPVR